MGGISKYGLWIASAMLLAVVGLMFFAVVAAASLIGGGGDSAGPAGGASVSCGSIETTDKMEGTEIPYPNTKLGIEGHLTDTHPKHYVGPDSDPLNIVGTGAYPPHTTDQERWYFNEYWPVAKGYSYEKFAHKKLLIQSKETKKCVVVSVEEAGPAAFVTARDGVGAGAPPEVHRALNLDFGSGYDANPSSDNSRITVQFVKDQKNTPLGPAK